MWLSFNFLRQDGKWKHGGYQKMNINIKQKIGMKQRLYHVRVQYSTEVSKYTTVYRLDSKTLATL